MDSSWIYLSRFSSCQFLNTMEIYSWIFWKRWRASSFIFWNHARCSLTMHFFEKVLSHLYNYVYNKAYKLTHLTRKAFPRLPVRFTQSTHPGRPSTRKEGGGGYRPGHVYQQGATQYTYSKCAPNILPRNPMR